MNDDFASFLISRLPVGTLQELYQEYEKQGSHSNSWLQAMLINPQVINILKLIWYYENLGKQRGETYHVKVSVSGRPKDPAKLRNDPITNDELIDFYKSL